MATTMVRILESDKGGGFPWGKHSISKGEPLAFQIGALSVWIKYQNHEIYIATRHEGGESGLDASADETLQNPPQDKEWGRWALRAGDSPKIRIDPAYPNLPVVVKPEMPFRLIEDAQVRVYVRVALWVQISLFGPPNVLLFEAPSIILSKTWFGSFTEGYLCYWISSGARRKVDRDLLRPYLAICPLQVINRSHEELKVEKLALHVENLSIFRQDGQLWADETRIIYRGNSTPNELHVAATPPEEASEAELLAVARDPRKGGLAAATVASLRSIPGLGFLMAGDR